MTTQLISPPAFVERMARHWTEALGNVASEPLRAAWLQMGNAFGRHIASHGDPKQGTEWTVLQPATGSGKSQGTAIYCAMLARYETTDEHPGVLIVTRLKADADEMADTINRWASRRGYARAYHSDATGPGVLESLRSFPVLVITHRAYELALDALGHDGSIRRTWPFFHGWGLGERRLVVIDEALDIVEESRGELEGLRLTLAAIPQKVRDQHATAVAAVQVAIDLLERMTARDVQPGERLAETILLREQVNRGTPPDITALRQALREVRFDWQLRKSDKELSRQQWVIHDDRLRALDMILRGWVYYAKVPTQGHTLNTARLLVPEEVKGAVVLDATATANVVYALFDKARVLKPPQGVRCYRNVTLHVSRGHKVGKVSMRNDGDALVSAVFQDLNERIPGRSAFIVSHLETEPRVLTHEADFEVLTGHWGKVTGSNQWRGCDVAVVIGLPYRPDTWSANTFMALQGVQTTEWLRANERPFGSHKDVRSALKLGQVMTDVVQAVNRIRCRRVIDSEGNCPTADVFLLLPQGPQGDEVLAGVVNLMAGINLQPWNLAGAVPAANKRGRKAGGKTSQMVHAAVAYLRQAMPGRFSKQELSKELGLTAKAWDSLVIAANDPTTDAAATLAAHKVVYRVEGAGRGARSWFLKAA
jgi:hypothetical protein